MSVSVSQLAPNVWILTTAPSAAATITLICPGETTQFIEVRNPSTYYVYPQLAVLHHPILTYPMI